MNRIIPILLVLFSLAHWNCSSDQPEEAGIDQLAVSWQLVSNQIADEPHFQATFTLTNTGKQTIQGDNWTLMFNQTPRAIIPGSVKGPADVQRINGDLYQLKPVPAFSLLPGDSLTVTYEGEAWLIKETDAPVGLYFVMKTDQGEGEAIPVSRYTIWPFERPEQYSRHKGDKNPYPDETWTYEQNAKVQLLKQEDLPPIIPTPVSVKLLEGHFTISENTKIYHSAILENEAELLNDYFATHFLGDRLEVIREKPAAPGQAILLELIQRNNGPEDESYELTIQPDGVTIKASTAAGIFYGVQSLVALIPVESWSQDTGELNIPSMAITDAPRFAYRGMFIDLSRNYNDLAAVKKLVDAMAFYKLNKLHLGLTNDEGWRLEIPGLPELTEYGSNRGPTADESDRLAPAYGSGIPGPDSYGSGYLTRSQFIELLQYTARRHIEVIPELNVPGHARAAVKSMEARFRKYSVDQNKEAAETYRLADPGDKSEYRSVQNYPDNVVCVCCEGTYRFYEKVVDEVSAMFTEAGVPLTTIHTGGDEVPNGTWTASPACEELIALDDNLESVADLPAYFFGRINQILLDRNLKSAGWEEIAMKKKGDGWIPHPDFIDRQVIPYVWNNLWGNQDLGYRLANAGYPVVLCNVTNLYFDMAYSRDPEEPGLYWGGFVDTRKVFDFRPFDIFQSTPTDAMGNPIDLIEAKKTMEQLKAEARKNIIGIQGQIWSESIKGPDMLEYYYFPKMIGLAERAWGPPLADGSTDKAWEVFANQLGQRELLRLNHLSGGYNYRLPLPGAKIIDGKVHANTAFPGLIIRYTTDGSEPTLKNSSIYTEPIKADSLVCLKTFDHQRSSISSRMVCISKQESF